MSSEVYYDYRIIDETYIKALQEQIEREKQRRWEEQLNLYEKIKKNEKKNIKLYSKSKEEYSKKHIIEEWCSTSNEEEVNLNEEENKDIKGSVEKQEKLDYSYLLKDGEKKYTVNDLVELPVKSKRELMRKRMLQVSITNYSEEEISEKVKEFISKVESLNSDELSIISEYKFIIKEMNMDEQEKSYEEINEDIVRIRRRYSTWREKKYINENLIRILNEENIIFDEENIINGIRCRQYKIDDDSDAALQIMETGTKTLLMEFVGIKSPGSTPSDEETRNVVEKANMTCKKMNRVCRRLLEECGIEMDIKSMCVPDVKTVKYIDKKTNVEKNIREQKERRVMYEI